MGLFTTSHRTKENGKAEIRGFFKNHAFTEFKNQQKRHPLKKN